MKLSKDDLYYWNAFLGNCVIKSARVIKKEKYYLVLKAKVYYEDEFTTKD